MNRDYEILNEKLDYMFEELMWLRSDFEKKEFERVEKELKYKLEDAQHDLERHKQDARWIMENLDERRKYYKTIKDRFPAPLEKPMEKVD
jgi:hypothetical protein